MTDPGEEAPPALTVFEPAADEEGPCWPPEPLVRTCQATLASSEAFGPMVAAEAQRRNFFAAQARAFLGDGGAWIWTLQRDLFPHVRADRRFRPRLNLHLSGRQGGGRPGRCGLEALPELG